jgi:hypothetical protein
MHVAQLSSPISEVRPGCSGIAPGHTLDEIRPARERFSPSLDMRFMPGVLSAGAGASNGGTISRALSRRNPSRVNLRDKL